MLRATLSLALLSAFAAPVAAQAAKSIDPGMTQAQVVERLGQPTAARVSGGFTYLFYKNGCPRECGIDDIVILENDAVVDAVFRASERAYTGKSSSPRAIPADVAAARGRPGARDVPGSEVTQAGSPTPPAEPPAEESKPAAETKPVTETKPAAEKPVAPAPNAAPPGDSARRDSTKSGTLRIKVKPQHNSSATAPAGSDSVRGGSKSRPPILE